MTHKVQVSGKDRNGNIYVIGGDDVDDFLGVAVGVLGGEDAQAVLDGFKHILPLSAGSEPTVAAVAAQLGATVVSGGGDSPVGPPCPHGPRQWKEGTSKAGKAYKGWFCGANVDDCRPEWRK